MARISRIGIKQTAKVAAVFYFIFSLLFVIPMSLMMIFFGSLGGDDPQMFGVAFGGVILIIMPLLYASMGFLMVTLFSFIYNQVAKRVGGVEIELSHEKKVHSSKHSK